MFEYKVYVKTDENGRITAINSSAFLHSLEGWQEIDSGYGDKYHHAQGNYFDKPLYDERGIHRYKIVPFVDWPEGKIIHEFFWNDEEYGVFERTQEEMDADYTEPVQPVNIETRVQTVETKTAELEESLEMLLTGVTADE